MKLCTYITSIDILISPSETRDGNKIAALYVKPDSKFYDKRDRHPSNLLETADFDWTSFIKELVEFADIEIIRWDCYYIFIIGIALTEEQLPQLPEIRKKVLEFCSKHFE
jgi:hypothetical protein